MIALTDFLPDASEPNVEYIRTKCLYDCYKDDKDVLFWEQDGGKAYISLASGDMTVFCENGDYEEIKEFISVISPRSIFGSLEVLEKLGFSDIHSVFVMSRKADILGETVGDDLKSREIYDILNVKEFVLPEYPYFAVDLCRRLNRGLADYFAIRNKCAAVSFHTGNYAVLNGIVSREKGLGTVALKAILQKNYGRELIVCCEEKLIEFYEKNGFKKLYKAGYRCKQQA